MSSKYFEVNKHILNLPVFSERTGTHLQPPMKSKNVSFTTELPKFEKFCNITTSKFLQQCLFQIISEFFNK